MSLKKYDNKKVEIIDIDNNCFEGNCCFNDTEYNEHEFGRDEDSIQILNIVFFESQIKKVREIKCFSDKYGMLEELIINSDVDFIEDAFDFCDKEHNERLILCLKDNIDNINEKSKVKRIIKNYDDNNVL